jgi:anti-sigma B factor antagonist
VETQQKNGVTVIIVDERLDTLAAPKFRETIREMSEQSKLKLVVDMTKTKLIDSTGCGVLVASLRTLLKNHGDIKIARPSPQAKTLFGLTRLDRVFEIYEDLDEAIKSFR